MLDLPLQEDPGSYEALVMREFASKVDSEIHNTEILKWFLAEADVKGKRARVEVYYAEFL